MGPVGPFQGHMGVGTISESSWTIIGYSPGTIMEPFIIISESPRGGHLVVMLVCSDRQSKFLSESVSKMARSLAPPL